MGFTKSFICFPLCSFKIYALHVEPLPNIFDTILQYSINIEVTVGIVTIISLWSQLFTAPHNPENKYWSLTDISAADTDQQILSDTHQYEHVTYCRKDDCSILETVLSPSFPAEMHQLH